MGGCRRPNSIEGRQATSAHSGACRSEGFVLGEDVPDGLGELAGDVDAGDLRATLPTETLLVPLVAFPVAGVTSRVGGGLDERPAQVLGTVLRERPTDIAVARLVDPRAEPGVAGQLLGAREAADVADLRGDGVGQDVTDARAPSASRGMDGWSAPSAAEVLGTGIDPLVQVIDHGQARGQR